MTDQVFLYLPLSVLEKERPLNNGRQFPMITFGTGFLNSYEKMYSALDVALETGYRSFDCVPIAKQEEYLGRALEELLPLYNLERKDIIIINKIFAKDYGVETTTEAFWRSCERLNVDYLDVYLMNWPGGENLEPEDEENRLLRMETWREMVNLNLLEKINTIGVSNFSVHHLEHIRSFSQIMPAINQVEFHPRFPQKQLLEYCKENNILLQAISFENTFHPLTVGDNVVLDVAKSVEKSPAQVVLKWIINRGVAVIPQSTSANRIKQYFELYDFVLEKPDMDALNSIDIREKYLRNPNCIL